MASGAFPRAMSRTMSRVLSTTVVLALCACAAAQSAEEEHEARAQRALADSLTDANAMMEHGSDSAKESAAQGVAQMAVETTITQPYHPTTFRNACVKAGTVERLISLIDPASGATINAQRHALSALEVLPPHTHTHTPHLHPPPRPAPVPPTRPPTTCPPATRPPCTPLTHPPPARPPIHPARSPVHLALTQAIATDDPTTDLDNGHARKICEMGACPHIVRLLSSQQEWLQVSAARCVAILAEDLRYRAVS
jgi:hypothetical protein